MAFTDAEKVKIRQYLGFSEAFHQINTRLESMMDDLANRSPAAVDEVRAILAKLATLDTQLDTSATSLEFKRAEDVEWNLGQWEQLVARGRYLIQRLAIMFEVDPAADYFGAATGGGGVIPLG